MWQAAYCIAIGSDVATKKIWKSVFKFGGSAVVLFGQKGAWRPADDILQYTREGMETYLRLGEVIAHRLG